MFHLILPYYILFYYHPLEAYSLSNKRQKWGGSGWEVRWEEPGGVERGTMEWYVHFVSEDDDSGGDDDEDGANNDEDDDSGLSWVESLQPLL